MVLQVSVRNVIYDWFSVVTGLDGVGSNGVPKTVWRKKFDVDGPSPRPETPYAMLNILNVQPRHARQHRPVYREDSEQISYLNERTFTLSTQVVGPDAHQYMQGAIDSLMISSKRDLLRRSQTTTVTVDTVTSLLAYTITLEGITVTYTSDADATAEEIRDGLIIAIDAESGFDYTVTADADPSKLVITSVIGEEFTVTTSDELSYTTEEAVSLAFIRTLLFMDLTGLLETSFEERVQVDFQFNQGYRTTELATTFIESGEVTNNQTGGTIAF